MHRKTRRTLREPILPVNITFQIYIISKAALPRCVAEYNVRRIIIIKPSAASIDSGHPPRGTIFGTHVDPRVNTDEFQEWLVFVGFAGFLERGSCATSATIRLLSTFCCLLSGDFN